MGPWGNLILDPEVFSKFLGWQGVSPDFQNRLQHLTSSLAFKRKILSWGVKPMILSLFFGGLYTWLYYTIWFVGFMWLPLPLETYIWVVFAMACKVVCECCSLPLFSMFCWSKLHLHFCVVVTNSWWNINKTLIKKNLSRLNKLWFLEVCMFVDFLIGYIVACYNEIGLCALYIDIGSKFVTLLGVCVWERSLSSFNFASQVRHETRNDKLWDLRLLFGYSDF